MRILKPLKYIDMQDRSWVIGYLAQCVLSDNPNEGKYMVSTQTKQTPLDMLVISQLASIRRSEAALQQRLTASPSMDAANFAAEVWKLQVSADRLNRMIDAMNLNTGISGSAVGSRVAA